MKNILLTLMVFGSFGAFADCVGKKGKEFHKCLQKQLTQPNIYAQLEISSKDDEFKKRTSITTKTLDTAKYYQDADVWLFFGISHFWKEEGINDDAFVFSLEGNVAFANANESDIYVYDNHSNRFNYAKAYNSEYQKGYTPYGYRAGVGCGAKYNYDCIQYFKTMEDKELIWRFYNGNNKIADLEIPKSFRSAFIKYFDEIQKTYK